MSGSRICVRPLFTVEVLRVGLVEWQPAGSVETYEVATRYADGLLRDMQDQTPGRGQLVRGVRVVELHSGRVAYSVEPGA